MKSPARFIFILMAILVMALAYLGGTLVSAETGTLLGRPHAPAITQEQWTALAAVNSLLLLDGGDDAATYLPLVLR